MSKAVLSSKDIVKELAQSRLKVKTDPPLLPFFFSHRALEQQQLLVRRACSLSRQSTAGTYLMQLTATTTKKCFIGLQSLWKVFKRPEMPSKQTFCRCFSFCSRCRDCAEHLGEARPVARLPCDSQSLHRTSQRTATAAQLQKTVRLLHLAAAVSSEVLNNTSKTDLIKKNKTAGKQNARSKQHISVASARVNLRSASVISWQSARDVFKGHVARKSVTLSWPHPGSNPSQRGNKPNPTICPPPPPPQREKGGRSLLGKLQLDLRASACAAAELDTEPEVKKWITQKVRAKDSSQAQSDEAASWMQWGLKRQHRSCDCVAHHVTVCVCANTSVFYGKKGT